MEMHTDSPDTMNSRHFSRAIQAFRNKYYGYDKSLIGEKSVFYSSPSEIESSRILSKRFHIFLDGFRFECFFHEKADDTLYVIYAGARDPKKELPHFPRWGYYNLLSGSVLCIEDPMFYRFPDLESAFFYGTESKSAIRASLELVACICRRKKLAKENVVFFSSSGGGYASVYAASALGGCLSISLNSRLYIQSSPKAKHFMDVTGYDLGRDDPLKRNDIAACIANSTAKHVLLYNAQSEHDWNLHMLPLCKAFDIHPRYGITTKQNICLWVYDCPGVPSAHVAFETKSIYMLIDYIAKSFYHGILSEGLCRVALLINESWHDLYVQKKLTLSQKGIVQSDFVFVSARENVFKKYITRSEAATIKNIKIRKSDSNYNYFRYQVTMPNHVYVIKLSDVKADFPSYTAGIYDFGNRRYLHLEEFDVSHDGYLVFCVGENIASLAMVIYAGVCGKTYHNELDIGTLEVGTVPFDAMFGDEEVPGKVLRAEH